MALKAMRELPDYEMAPGSPDLLGWNVHDSEDQTVGTVEDLLVDTDTDEVRYLGLQLGDGRKVMVAVGSLDLDEDMGVVRVVNRTRSELEALPTYTPPHLTTEEERRYFVLFHREEPVGAWDMSPLDYKIPPFRARGARMEGLLRAPRRRGRQVPVEEGPLDLRGATRVRDQVTDHALERPEATHPSGLPGEGVGLFAANDPWDLADVPAKEQAAKEGRPFQSDLDRPGPRAGEVLWQAEQPGMTAAFGGARPTSREPEFKGEIAEPGPEADREVLWQAEQPGLPSGLDALRRAKKPPEKQ